MSTTSPSSKPRLTPGSWSWIKDEALRLSHSAWFLLRHRPSGAAVLVSTSLAILLLTAAGNALVSFITQSIKGIPDWADALVALGTFTGALGFSVLAWVLRQNYSSVSEETCFSGAEPRQVLVFFVSYQSYLDDTVPPSGPVSVGDALLERASILDDARLLDEKLRKPPFSWEMLLRGIHPHHNAGALRRVYLVGSTPGARPDDKGTRRMLQTCRNFLRPYLPESVLILPWPAETAPSYECDFEMVEHVVKELKNLIDHDRATYQSREDGICIDITGGQKPSSAAAMLVSLNRRVNIQYVQTSPPKEAHSYNISFAVGPDRILDAPFARE